MSLADVVAMRTKELYWTVTRVTGTKPLFDRVVGASSLVSTRISGERTRRPRQLRQSVPHFYECDLAKKATFDRLLANYYEHSGPPSDPVRVLHFFNLLESVRQLEGGDYLELGVYRGSTARIIHELMDPAATLFLLDTYQGFDEKDIKAEKAASATDTRFVLTTPEAVAAYVGGGKPQANVKPVQGWFPETYRELEDRRWRFIHIDLDLYKPMKTALTMLWPSLLPGGVLLLHDYGCHGFPGAKQAVDEFADEVGLQPIVLADRWGSAVFRKPGHASATRSAA